ncbi:MAG: DUF255 domain-containing protein [Planctomycetes bacterium]|nr:DUF255 domain-containing protein [Planctomycetota bacterium]MCH9727684.1 DUF255 domain-containing protein [Planctomycetota bacterium]MCH9775109.1 DUF255 domain-containing protein [Planctomycetota bacterium]MCH9790243.1 DUF255 domain-containing protein [Planctomycetota bacterium]MDF1745361.1 DUF255 domain-containing protein [Gimesia sp.]
MRPLYLLLFSICLISIPSLSNSVQGEEIRWQTNLQQAAKRARAEDKAMLIQIGASWCGFCHKMERETFKDAKVVKHINSCFVPIQVDADESTELVEAIGVPGLPMTVIISPQLKIVKKISGYVPAHEMQGHLNKICVVKHEQPIPARSRPAIQKISRKQVVPEFAFKGVCLVSMLDDQLLVKGESKFHSEYNGRKVCFSSAGHKKQFDSDPERYWPAFGGNCRVSRMEKKQAVEGNPQSGGVYREKLVFFTSAENRDRFSSNPSMYILQPKN